MRLTTVAKTRFKRFVGNIYQASVLVRKGLPHAFTLPLVAAGGLYFLVLFPLLVYKVVPDALIGPLVSSIAELFRGDAIPDHTWLGRVVWAFVYLISATLTFVLAAAGVFLSYYAAGLFYRLYRRLYRAYVRRVLREEHVTEAVLPSNDGGPPEAGPEGNPLAGYERIGIILSGGGAKGAYQAGAMKAVYEFLEEHGAHDKVCMIAGTSIGSWNALFWLAGLVKERNGGESPLERWWSRVNVRDVIQPVSYVPTRHNYFLSNEPWKEAFDDLFQGTPAGARLQHHIENAGRPGTMNFYFTRSNIGKASLAYTTNRNSWDDVSPNLQLRRAPRAVEGDYLLAERLSCVRDGVFSSMDIPPLFEYSCDGDRANFFEDGGVVDNLPIRFGTEIENCDLLFILPLNASFDRKVNRSSVFKRLARVTEIRQGVLERNSFKMIYLYNELAGLREELDTSRERVKELERNLREMAEGRARGGEEDGSPHSKGKRLSDKKIAARARRRSHRVVHVFSICPGPELKIYTTEFWKTKEAGEAFRFMYDATKKELKKFRKTVMSDVISTAIVGPYDPARLEFLKEVDEGKNVSYEDTPEVKYRVEYFTDF